MDLIVNGEFTLSGDAAYLKVFGPRNRALSYAEGAFESLALKNGCIPPGLQGHLDRWIKAADALDLESAMLPGIEELTDHFRIYSARRPQQTWSRVRMQFCRKPGGLYTPATKELDWWIYFLPMPAPEQEPGIIGSVEIWPGVLHSTRMHPELKLTVRGLELTPAATWSSNNSHQLALLLNQNGALCGAVGGSLVVWKDPRECWSPSMESGALQGVTLEILKTWGSKQRIKFSDGQESPEILNNAAEIWILNAVQGVRVLEHWRGRRLSARQAPIFQTYWLNLHVKAN